MRHEDIAYFLFKGTIVQIFFFEFLIRQEVLLVC